MPISYQTYEDTSRKVHNNKKVEKKMQVAYDTYWNTVQDIANAEFERIVKPYLIRHGYSFKASNGAYFVYYDDPGVPQRFVSIDERQLPLYLLNILDQDIDGARSNSLGTIMPDFKNPKRRY